MDEEGAVHTVGELIEHLRRFDPAARVAVGDQVDLTIGVAIADCLSEDGRLDHVLLHVPGDLPGGLAPAAP